MAKHVPPADEDHEEGGWGWCIVIAAFICFFFSKGTNVSLGIFFVAFLEHFDRGAAETSWIPSLAAGMAWIIAPLSTALAKKYGHRKIIAVGSIVCFSSVALSSFSKSLWQLAATVGFLNGMGYGLIHSNASSFIGFYFKKRYSLASGLAFTGIGAGSLALPPLFQYCIDLYGWEGGLLVFAGLSAHLCVAAALMRPLRKRQSEPSVKNSPNLSSEDNKETGEPHKPEEVPLANLDEFDGSNSGKTRARIQCTSIVEFFDCDKLVKHSYYLLYLVTFALFSFGQIISVVHLAPRINSVGQSKDRTALLLSLYGAGNIIGAPSWGTFINNFAKVHDNIDIFMAAVYMLYGVTVLLLPMATDTLSIAVFVVALGFERGSFSAQTPVLVRRLVGNELFTTAYGWALLVASFGQLTGAPISGFIVDHTGSYAYSFYLAGSLMILSGLGLLAAAGLARKCDCMLASHSTDS